MCGCRDEVLLELNGKTYMLSLKVYETVKTDVAYVQDKTVSQIYAVLDFIGCVAEVQRHGEGAGL